MAFLTPEFFSLVGGSFVGFLFKYLAEQRQARQEEFKMLIEANKLVTKNQNAAVARVSIEAGKVVRRVIVLCILFGTIIAPFILPFFGIPTVVEIRTQTEPFLGIFGGGEKITFHNVYGYLFTEENRQILISIVGFYFGSAVAKK